MGLFRRVQWCWVTARKLFSSFAQLFTNLFCTHHHALSQHVVVTLCNSYCSGGGVLSTLLLRTGRYWNCTFRGSHNSLRLQRIATVYNPVRGKTGCIGGLNQARKTSDIVWNVGIELESWWIWIIKCIAICVLQASMHGCVLCTVVVSQHHSTPTTHFNSRHHKNYDKAF